MNSYKIECAWMRRMVLAKTVEEAIEKFKKEVNEEKGLEENQKEITRVRLLYGGDEIIG